MHPLPSGIWSGNAIFLVVLLEWFCCPEDPLHIFVKVWVEVSLSHQIYKNWVSPVNFALFISSTSFSAIFIYLGLFIKNQAEGQTFLVHIPNLCAHGCPWNFSHRWRSCYFKRGAYFGCLCISGVTFEWLLFFKIEEPPTREAKLT